MRTDYVTHLIKKLQMFSIAENNFQTLQHSHKDWCGTEYNVPHCSVDSSHIFFVFPEHARLVSVLKALQELFLMLGMLLSSLHMAASHRSDLTSNVPSQIRLPQPPTHLWCITYFLHSLSLWEIILFVLSFPSHH